MRKTPLVQRLCQAIDALDVFKQGVGDLIFRVEH